MSDPLIPVEFRPISESDLPLLQRIYSSSREDEMALLTYWTEEDKSAFLRQQFEAQHTYYMQQCPDADFSIILYEGIPAGRLYVDDRPTEMRIVDITLLPPFRNLGIGTQILKDLHEKRQHSAKAISIHVERNNRARRFYDRLGFQITDDSHPIYLLMTWPYQGRTL